MRSTLLCLLLFFVSATSSAQISKWNDKDDYIYYADKTCTPSVNKICISEADAKAACLATKDITTNAVKRIYAFSSQEDEKFMKAVPLIIKGTAWVGARCLIGLEWKGFRNGTSSRIFTVRDVTAFGKDKKDILALEISYERWEQMYGHRF